MRGNPAYFSGIFFDEGGNIFPRGGRKMESRIPKKAILLLILINLFGFVLIHPESHAAMTLNNAANITQNSLDLSWSGCTSPTFARYELYQSLAPITDPAMAVQQVPTLSEWVLLGFIFLIFLSGILLLKKRHRIAGIGLILLSLSSIAYGLVTIPPISVITDIRQTSYHASSLQSNTLYYFRVCAFNADGTYDLSNQVTAQTTSLPGNPPTISSFSANPGTINSGGSSTLSWNITGATSATIDHGIGSVNPPGSGSVNVSPTSTTTYTLTATNANGSVTAQGTVTVNPGSPPTVVSFSANPGTIISGGSSTLSWTITNATSASIDHGIGSVNPGSGSVDVSPASNTTYTLTATNGAGSSTAQVTVTVSGSLPPDPSTVAPPVDRTVSTDMNTATSFLYTGYPPIQTGVAPGAIDPKRTAVLRGKVLDKDNSPLPGVTITILNHPEYGQTLSRLDGMFDMAVNGGGHLTVDYQKGGYLPAQRQVNVPWQEYAWLSDVVLITLDSQVTTIDLTASIPMQMARGSVVTDGDGTRQATLFFPQGTQAQLVMPNGTLQPITTLSVRVTEFTVGPSGPNAMPAELPPTSVYTYCVDFSADEARAAGAKSVHFSQPVIAYLENFLGFPVSIAVPMGYYDLSKGVWVPMLDGRVIKILSITPGGLAELDTDGDNAVDNGAAMGITDAERRKLAEIYSAGQILWRTIRSHFSYEDWNWPLVIRPDEGSPDRPAGKPGDAGKQHNPCKKSGLGCIEYQNQIFGETVPVVGTPFTLNYSSDRVSGYRAANTVEISLSGNTVPAPLVRIDLEITVAGRRFTQSFPALPNQTYTFTWDGKDAYGRPLQGKQTVIYRLGYVYPAYYSLPAWAASAKFGLPSASIIPGGWVGRPNFTLWQEEMVSLNLLDFRDLGLGGWSLSANHHYDFQGRILFYGDGSRRGIDNMNSVFETIAGGGNVLGDGGPATQAKLNPPRGISVGPDGSLYIVDGGHRSIRRVTPDGTITTVAGNGTYCFPTDPCGDGGPALLAPLSPMDVAIGPDGSLYIADNFARRIRKVGTDGIITRVAGAMTSSLIFNGDEIPALDAVISPQDLEVAPDGTIYFVDNIRNPDNSSRATVRRIGPDGIIHRYIGNGGDWNCNVGEACGDGGAAIDATILPTDLAVGPDGSLYVYSDNTYTVRRVGPDGIIQTVAGKYDDQPGMADGVLATQTHFYGYSVALDRNGLLHIGEHGWWDWGPSGPVSVPSYRVRRVGNDQIIATVAGGADDNSYSQADEKGPAAGAHFSPFRIAFGPDGSLYVSDLFDNRVFRVRPVFKGFDLGDILIASEDGSLLYQFNATGRHLGTINALTGATLYQFGYDAHNRLISITDGDGNVTNVERDAGGNPTGIVGPYGQRTTLTLNAGGYLASVTNPASETTQLGYGTEGLLTSVTGPKGAGFTYSMTYDGLGRLTLTQDPAGGGNTLSRTDLASGHEVGITTALGRTSSYLTETLPTLVKHFRNTFQDGTATDTYTGTDGITATTLPDGTVTTGAPGPDPRFGMQAPLSSTFTVTTPGGGRLTSTLGRTVALSDPSDPLSITSMTSTLNNNGRTSNRVFDGTTRTFADSSPMGRQSMSTINSLGRVIRLQAAGIEPITFDYDARGRLVTMTQGTGPDARVTTYVYDSNGHVAAITDPLGRTVEFTHDAAGRLTSQLMSGNRTILYEHDAHGNIVSVTPPGRTVHGFSYNSVDKLIKYSPPALSTGATDTLFQYNADRQLLHATQPDGSITDFSYDSNGRLSSLGFPVGQMDYTYDPSGNFATITAPNGETLSFVHDKGALVSELWGGTIAGIVTRNYDNSSRVTSININGTDSFAFQYNDGDQLTNTGDLFLDYDSLTGLLTGSSLGNVTDAWTYNGFAEPLSYTANYGGTGIFSEQYFYDKLGRIIQRTEIIGGNSDSYDYVYDLAGRLIEVKKNGTTASSYIYDSNGNRVGADHGSPVTATYDEQDRLLQYGNYVYQYNSNGEMQTKTVTGQVTAYQFDYLGNLAGITLPDGRQIEYLTDVKRRRIGKRTNGSLIQGFLYQGDLNPVAELDGNNHVVSLFVYASHFNVPDYMVKAGIIYRIILDHLGSPRLVVNVLNGLIAQRIDYDEFGRILLDTNPGFQPFGFAGGLYDHETGLVHFGARDYDPQTGRWILKDPIGFEGGDTNLYGYVLNDPINLTDPYGCGAPIHGVIGPGQTILKNTKFEIGGNKGPVMVRWGTQTVGDEAYRVQVRINGNLIHIASNRAYGGELPGMHLAVNSDHYYADRTVVEDLSQVMEMRQHFATKIPYYGPAMTAKPYAGWIRQGMKVVLPCVKYGGGLLEGVGWALLWYDFEKYAAERYSNYIEQEYLRESGNVSPTQENGLSTY
jgi:RHS repeat-associated protein